MAEFVKAEGTEVGKTLGEIAKDIVASATTATETTNNGDLLKAHGLKVIHFRPVPEFGIRGMTIAYRQSNRNTVEIATAIVHTLDTFTKKIGTRTAAEAFISGRTTLLPLNKYYPESVRVVRTLQNYFG